jgi:hypothetical protein
MAQAQLYTQAVHTPGASGGNGFSAVRMNLSGSEYDRQAADDFNVTGPGWLVNGISSSWVQATVGDPNPVTDIRVSFFERTGSGDVGSLIATATGVSVTRTTGPGTYFGRPEEILRANFNAIVLNPGSYFVMFQPVVDHNWFWLTAGGQLDSAAHIRRGPETGAGIDTNWPTEWTAVGPNNPVFTSVSDLNFTVHGEVVPEPATLAALGIGAVALMRRRRKA